MKKNYFPHRIFNERPKDIAKITPDIINACSQNSFLLSECVTSACQAGQIELLNQLLFLATEKSSILREALILSAENNSVPMLQTVLHFFTSCSAESHFDAAIDAAIERRSTDTLIVLFGLSSLEAQKIYMSWACDQVDGYAFKIMAPLAKKELIEHQITLWSHRGREQTVEFLLPFADPKTKKTEAFLVACRYGNLSLVKMLAPYANPKERSSEALAYSVVFGKKDVFEFLLPLSNGAAALQKVKKARTDHEELPLFHKLKNIVQAAADKKAIKTSVEKIAHQKTSLSKKTKL